MPTKSILFTMFETFDLQPYPWREEGVISEAHLWLIERIYKRPTPTIGQPAKLLLQHAVRRTQINWREIYYKYIKSMIGSEIPTPKTPGEINIEIARTLIYNMIVDQSTRQLTYIFLLMEDHLKVEDILATIEKIDDSLTNIYADVLSIP
jgi:hypothetical protein